MVPDTFLYSTHPLCLAILLSLRQMHDSGFCVFRGYVSMARFPMFNGFFQMCDPFAHMRIILASLQGMLQRGFRMGQECLSMTLFAMVHRFFRVIEGVLEVLLFLTHNVAPRPRRMPVAKAALWWRLRLGLRSA